MNIDLVILVTSVATSMLLATIVFLRNPHAKINRIFAILSGSISLWAVSNFLADNGPASTTLFFTRTTFVFGVLIAYAASALSANFPKGLYHERTFVDRLLGGLMVAVAVLCYTPYFVTSAVKGEAGAHIEIGPLYTLFLLLVAAVLVRFVYNFVVQYRTAVAVTQKRQINLVLAGIILYAVFAITSNLVLPLIVNNWTSSRYGPISALFTVALIGYAIVRHGLLDIRLIIVRSLVYVQVLAIIAALYGFIVLGIARLLFDFNISVNAQIILSLATGLSVLLFPYLKRAIDRVTNSVLYRDAYDPESFFKEVNQVLVSNIDLNKLLTGTMSVIEKNLKTEFCVAVLRPDGARTSRFIGQANSVGRVQNLGVGHTKHWLSSHPEEVIVTDVLPPEAQEFKEALIKSNVAMLARIGRRADNSHGLGYLLFGPKRSGNPYNLQDVKVIDAMADGLAVAIQNALRFEEIQKFNVTLEERIDEATRKLRRTNDKLRTLDQTKDDFISMASHQLRTPLTSVKGYVSMVLDGDAGKITPLQRKLLNQSFVSSQRMVYLISDLLNVSRLRTGKFVIEPIRTNLADVVEGEVAQLVEAAKSRNLQLTYNKPEHFPLYMLDETKLRQVIMNFVDNAIYYTPSGGSITVNLIEKPQSIEFTVVDTGMGVPKRDQPHLFTKFFRAHNAKRARPDGTGLGLFMAKKVTIAQGGAIIFRSQEGKGSTFGFTFAKTKLQSPPTLAR